MNTYQNSSSYENPGLSFLETVMYQTPNAYAKLQGDPGNKNISGIIRFYTTGTGVLVNAEVYDLPSSTSPCSSSIHGFHIHTGSNCDGSNTEAFPNAGMHYNPSSCLHPAHAGDLPPLFSYNGFAWMLYYTERFTISEILGKTIIVHDKPDDFHTQPSGNSGNKIACGVITASK